MSRYLLRDETRKRCKVAPLDQDHLLEYRQLQVESFEIFAEYGELDFSLFLMIGEELVEFIRPEEARSRELFDQIKAVMEKKYDNIALLLRRDQQKSYETLQQKLRTRKMAELLNKDPNLDQKTLQLFSDLSSVSQMVVKGGIDEGVIGSVTESAHQMISHISNCPLAVSTLSRMVQADPTLYDHSASVAMIAGVIATRILGAKMPLKLAEMLAIAAIYHDVGKTAIPNHILNKPGKFEPEEFEIMKHHTTKGYEELVGVIKGGAPLPELAARVAWEHHEKFNGNGYPRKRKGRAEEDPENGIHLFSRIVTIADVYSALLMKRVYKPSYNAAEAIQIMADTAGNDYDPTIFIAFVKEVVASFNEYNEKKKGDQSRIFVMDDGKLKIVG